MERINTPQTRCRAGVARRDITPPVGMYHRMWGAALHDCSTGVHRPLEAAVLWLEPLGPASGNPRVIVSLDHCILDLDDSRRMRQSIADSTGVDIADIELTLTHTHGAGRITRTRADFPGGTLIGPYLDDVIAKLGPLAVESAARTVPVTMLHGQGHSTLAAERDYHDAQRDIVVCGRNPRAAADTTLLVVKIVDDQARTVATLVNYACHPTTLAWQNTLISPDYVGALRETVETHTQAPCLFLQGLRPTWAHAKASWAIPKSRIAMADNWPTPCWPPSKPYPRRDRIRLHRPRRLGSDHRCLGTSTSFRAGTRSTDPLAMACFHC
ncbi:MAG: hypothetical protein R3C12_03430 [Planctomycetaceae bacterium]